MASNTPDNNGASADSSVHPLPESGSQAGRRKPKHDFTQTQAGKLWDAFGNPEQPVNTMPGGTYNTAGGRPTDYTWKDVFTFGKTDIERFYKGGCSRDALLVGIGAGGSVGGLMWILKG
ncbi:hypothetical protein UCRPC4_g06223 [Phaeomoniella chlamydospora]|uniref:Cytochrome c oxidase assembly protein COX20, mitochondrial n=1 Tax=Phaeomoniella chlamydospora TaxID=158046 RepID=A0A0G2DZR7_PHACM|nr:hypothetical protein UCRPC4_g06223 [Phaeomoniella chlamydospora]